MIIPSQYQPPLPLERLILQDGVAGAGDRMELDVLVVGAGPAGLACAIELARLAKADATELNIGVLEKAEALGEHSLSGAVVNPRALRELFPDLKDADFPFRGPVTKEAVYLLTKRAKLRLPTPPTMHNRGYYVASLCEIVRWLGAKAEELGVNLFTGFPAAQLLVRGTAVAGVRTAPAGLDRDSRPTAGGTAPNDLVAKVTALAEGTRGMLAQAWCQWQHVAAANPQIFALGVKELWETKQPLDRVIHTLGWPLPSDAFGGSFIYPLESKLVALGLVVGLDYRDAALDVHVLLQQLKQHPLLQRLLAGGEMIEWGAKTIPEGGYYSLPQRRTGDGVALLGDAAGFVDVPSLKGIHYAIQSGIYAARAIFQHLKNGAALTEYDRALNASYVASDLYRTRNMRLAFRDGFYLGGLQAGLMTLTGGRFPGGKYTMHADAEAPRTPGPELEVGGVSKVDAVFKSGNSTRDTIPSHLIAAPDVPLEVARFYSHMCPAGVYEAGDGRLRINAPNCVDCKATDILGPRWTPREGGSGPKYKRM
ncbi:MAG TPA: electron-transfer flavoprotein:ubiquinone oxidoreductase [Gemmatimonadales bacterium]|jgi:electron-transferring-flavoprotein dehydrogenase|nr:electron-transfer flavoprotein:ubiquinone oxidoreductase [Gemmatimonadales bacterium]